MQEGFAISQEDVVLDFGILVAAHLGNLLYALDAVLHGLEVLELELGVDDFLATTFRMYGSECQEVELICDNSVIDAIIDRFGTDVTIYACDMSTFRVIVRVAISHIFFSWIFGFGGKVRIKGPEETKRQYAAMIRDAAAELE